MTREFRLENQIASSNIFAAVDVQIPKILGPVSVNYRTGQLRHGLSTYLLPIELTIYLHYSRFAVKNIL